MSPSVSQRVSHREQHLALVADLKDRLAVAALGGSERSRERHVGRGKLLVPAFSNAHAHAPMTLLRGYAENLPLQAWLNDMVWPFEAKMTPEDNYWATLLACAEMAPSVTSSTCLFST